MSDPVSTQTSAADEGRHRLEAELKAARRFGERATRQMHKALAADLKKALARARRAEEKAAGAQTRARLAMSRAKLAERELATLKNSSTWKAGRAVVAIPTRLRGWRRS